MTGCSGTSVEEGAELAAKPEPATPDAVPGVPQFIMEFTSGREAVLACLAVGVLMYRALPEIYHLPHGRKGPNVFMIFWVMAKHGIPLAFVTLFVKMILFDDHWIIDPAGRQILSHRRFLGRVSIEPLLAFDAIGAVVLTRTAFKTKDGTTQHREEIHFELKDGSTRPLTATSFNDVPEGKFDGKPHARQAALAALVGAEFRVVERES